MHRWMVVVAAAAVAGCGPSTTTPMSDGGTTAGESGTDDTDESGADTLDDDSGSGESGVVDVCEEFADETMGLSPLSLQIRNAADQPILLADPCSGYAWMELATPSEWTWPPDICSGTCQETFEQGCFDCGPCASAAYRVVEPGATVTVDWDGRLYERLVPPVSCFEAGACAQNCQVARAPVETITFTVEAITEADCVAVEEFPEEACACEATADGWCETFGNALIEPTLMATMELQPGAAGPIVIEIGG